MGGHYKNVVTAQPKREDFYGPTNPSAQILENINQIIIRQHLSVVEAVTGFDKVNKYNIWDGKTGSQIFTAREGQIGCCTRNFFQGNREFDMPFLDASNQEAFQLNKNRSLALYGCCLCSCCMNCNKCFAKCCCGYDNDFSNLSVNRNGTKDYYIHQIQNFNGHPHFAIENTSNNQTEFTVTLPTCCFSAYNCTDVVYDVHDSKGNLVANITKWWAGGKSGIEGCCIEGQNASTYVIDTLGGGSADKKLPGYSDGAGGQSLDTKQKSALIGVTMLIDYSFYQMKDNSG